MTVTRSKFSERQAGGGIAVDVLAGSPQMRRRPLNLSPQIPSLVVQATTKYTQHIVVQKCKVTLAYVTFAVAPVCSGGTATLGIDYIAADGSTATVIVTAADILAGYTAFIPVLQTLAATNPTTCAVGGAFRVTVTTSNNSVGTADLGASIVLLTEPIEDAIISDSDNTTANA